MVNANDKNANVLKPVSLFEDISSWQTLFEDAAWLEGKKTILGFSSGEVYFSASLVNRL